jgi:hypothetical protein
MLTLLAALALTAVAGADVLWDQSDYNGDGPGYFNSESGSPPFGMTMFTLNDIVVDEAWHVTSISTIWSILDPNWANLSEGYLNVFPKTGSLPAEGDDPTLGTLVPMSAVVEANIGTLTATVDLMLEPGEYWIGITPIAPSGPFGVEVQYASGTLVGDASVSYDAFGMPTPMWMVWNMDTDATILIEGDVTVATEEHSLSGVKALFR